MPSFKADVSPPSFALTKGYRSKRQLSTLLGRSSYVIYSVVNIELPCYTLLQKQHLSFFRNLPSLYNFKCIILCYRLNNGRNRLLHFHWYCNNFWSEILHLARIIKSKKKAEHFFGIIPKYIHIRVLNSFFTRIVCHCFLLGLPNNRQL